MSCNVAIVRGACSSAPEIRTLDSGTVLAVVQLTVRSDDGPATSVPVVVWDPPAFVERLDVGDELVVLGRVRRRFYRAGASAASRVEVEASHVAPGSDRRRVRSVFRRARDLLETADA
jgi:single-strand DNA-binding protein